MHIARTQTTRRAAYGLLAAASARRRDRCRDRPRQRLVALHRVHRRARPRGAARRSSPGLEKGRLHPRAVPLYNALHSLSALRCSRVAAIAAPAGALIGALAWALHISFDRSIGYGMRTRDGFQRS